MWLRNGGGHMETERLVLRLWTKEDRGGICYEFDRN